MNSHEFEMAILGGPTLGESATAFMRIKSAAKNVPPPDETGMLEGQFSVPVEKAISVMSELVKNEFETIYAYHVYAQSLRGLHHDSIAEHFDEHADEELEHADFLLKRMAVLGGSVSVPDVESPAPSTDPIQIIKTMIRMEQDGIAGWRKLIAILGDNPMKVVVEDYAAQEQEHLDDLWQLLPHEANRPVLQQKTAVSRTWIRKSVEEAAAAPARLKQFANNQARRSTALKDADYESIYRANSPTNKADWAAGVADKRLAKTAAGEALPEESLDPYQRQMVGHQLLSRRNLGGVGGLIGAIPAAIGGSVLASHYGKTGPLGTALGGVGGALAGAAPGVIYALKQQKAYEDMNNPEMKFASKRCSLVEKHQNHVRGQTAKLASLRKAAFGPEFDAWAAQEQMMQQAQEQAEADYFKAQAQEAQAAAQQKDQELQQMQQQMQQIQQQQEQLQQQVDASGAMQQQVLEQARQVEQSAAQSAAAAHQTATASMLQAMRAQQEVLQHKGLTANIQQNVQRWKDQLAAIAQADPASGAEAQVASPEASTAPVPTQGPEVPQAPADMAASAEGNPYAPAPGGEAQPQAPAQPASPEQTMAPATKQANARLIGAAVGAPIGAFGAYMTSRAGGKDPEADARIAELEAMKAKGETSFREAVELVKMKAKAGLLEAAADHPISATAAGALAGGMAGYSMGPDIGALPGRIKTVSTRFAELRRAAGK